jgi:hypothetical protein
MTHDSETLSVEELDYLERRLVGQDTTPFAQKISAVFSAARRSLLAEQAAIQQSDAELKATMPRLNDGCPSGEEQQEREDGLEVMPPDQDDNSRRPVAQPSQDKCDPVTATGSLSGGEGFAGLPERYQPKTVYEPPSSLPAQPGGEECGHYYAQDGVCIYCHATKPSPSTGDSALVKRLKRAVKRRDPDDKDGPGECCYAPYVCIAPETLEESAAAIERLERAALANVILQSTIASQAEEIAKLREALEKIEARKNDTEHTPADLLRLCILDARSALASRTDEA